MNLPNTLSKTLYIVINGLSKINESSNNDPIQLFSSHFDKHWTGHLNINEFYISKNTLNIFVLWKKLGSHFHLFIPIKNKHKHSFSLKKKKHTHNTKTTESWYCTEHNPISTLHKPYEPDSPHDNTIQSSPFNSFKEEVYQSWPSLRPICTAQHDIVYNPREKVRRYNFSCVTLCSDSGNPNDAGVVTVVWGGCWDGKGEVGSRRIWHNERPNPSPVKQRKLWWQQWRWGFGVWEEIEQWFEQVWDDTSKFWWKA